MQYGQHAVEFGSEESKAMNFKYRECSKCSRVW